MKAFKKIIITFVLMCAILLPTMATTTVYAQKITTTATGYTKASDVQEVFAGKYLANWGARGEDATFLSTRAEKFYTGNNVYSIMKNVSGGSTQSNAPQSALYSALKSLMSSKHTNKTSYGATRDMYKYTDCVQSNYSKISSFYSGTVLNGAWDSGSTWNREHTWPNSKGLGGSDENDIIMLRPTSVSENSARGNTAYGESSAYFDPGESVRGDCARICLYVYVRWGNTGKMWGTSGVMENMSVLLKWMEEDPVDTWEMGRNDACEVITKTRNVFVDYPEYAWLLFGKEIPEDMVTPSSGAKEECEHTFGEWKVISQPTTTQTGLKERACTKCGHTESAVIEKLPQDSSSDTAPDDSSSDTAPDDSSSDTAPDDSSSDTAPDDSSGDITPDDSSSESECNHSYGDWYIVKRATVQADGLKARDCAKCGHTEERAIKKLEETEIHVSVSGGSGSSCSSSLSATYLVSLLLSAGFIFILKSKGQK